MENRIFAMKFGRQQKDIILIVLTYSMVHGFMLLISGVWWDGVYLYNIYKIPGELKEYSLYLGRPSVYYILSFMYSLPMPLTRLVIFLSYLAIAIMIYKCLILIGIERADAVGITVIFNAIPINDARVMACVYPYAFGLLFFWVGAYLLLTMLQSTPGETVRKPQSACSLNELS